MTDAEDFWDQPHIKVWADSVLNDMLPKVQNSDAVITLLSSEPDLKLMVETGAAVLLNKPIILAVMPGGAIPEKLRRVADEVVIFDDGLGPDAARQLQAAVERVMSDAEPE